MAISSMSGATSRPVAVPVAPTARRRPSDDSGTASDVEHPFAGLAESAVASSSPDTGVAMAGTKKLW